jgi:hypothetical protein
MEGSTKKGIQQTGWVWTQCIWLGRNNNQQRWISWLAAALLLPHDRLRPTESIALPYRPTTAPCSDGWPNTIFVSTSTLHHSMLLCGKWQGRKFICDFEDLKSLTERSEQKALRLRFQGVAAVTSQKHRSAASRWESVGTATASQLYR